MVSEARHPGPSLYGVTRTMDSKEESGDGRGEQSGIG